MPKPVPAAKKQMMLEDPIEKVIPRMAVPTIVAQMITIIYNLVDTLFVSALGTNATAAVGINSSLEMIITLAGMTIGTGACSYIARLLGAGRKKEADEVYSSSFFSGFFIGVAIMAAGRIGISGIVDILGATPECRAYSMQYAEYVLYAAPFMIVSLIMNMCLRSEGSAMLAMVGIGFGSVLNCFLDPLFIFTFGLGVTGASMATAISKLVSCAILIYPYLKKRTAVDLSWKSFRYTKEGAAEVIKIGSTAFLRQGLMVVSNTVMNRIAGGFSTSVLAAVSVANRVMMFPFGAILGFGQGFQPVVGFNWGAGRYDRVKKAFTFSSMVSLIGSALICVFFFIFAKPLIRLFTKTDEHMMAIGAFCIRAQCLALPIHAWVSIINMFYAGIGKAVNAILLSTARQGYLYIPMLLILPPLFGEYGLAASVAAADALSFFVALPMAAAAVKLINGKIEQGGLV